MEIKTGNFLLAVLMAGVLFISGCTGGQAGAPPQDNGQIQGGDGQAAATQMQGNVQPGSGGGSGPQGYGNRSGFGRNLTNAQRQQMVQQAADACKGLSIGNPCTLQSQRGNFSGNCTMQNGTLACGFGNGNRPGRFNRTSTG